MKPPPILLGITTIFYGYQIGHLFIAISMALIIEAPFLINLNINITKSFLQRVIGLTIAASIILLFYFISTTGMKNSVLQIVQWSPFILMPLIIVKRYSASDRIDLFNELLELINKTKYLRRPKIDLGYIYFSLCLLAASIVNEHALTFYLCLFALSVWALWFFKPRYYSISIWVGMMLLVGLTGYMGHIGLNKLQHIVTDAAIEILAGTGDTDPYKSRTSMGHIGNLKLSDRIIMRVKLPDNIRTPYLLHEASFDKYFQNNWFARDANLKLIKPEADKTAWRFSDDSSSTFLNIKISSELNNGSGVLPLPSGTVQVNAHSITELKRNRFGTTRVESEADYLHYEALSNSIETMTAAPTDNDLLITEEELPAIERIVKELDLKNKQRKDILESIKRYFSENYTYSLYNEGNLSETALGDFFDNTHSGHCEYFAAATVLLLRSAGVPARYATGFSVMEYSDLEKIHIVRLRHAHAWARVYMGGVWIDLDTTPASWSSIEDDNAAIWEPLLDLWSWLMFQIDSWEIDKSKSLTFPLVVLALIVLLYYWNNKRKRDSSTKIKNNTKHENYNWPGMDSELLIIEQCLREDGLGKKQDESVSAWINRITTLEPTLSKLPLLHEFVTLHYRYRFCSKGLITKEREELSERAREWLEQYSSTK